MHITHHSETFSFRLILSCLLKMNCYVQLAPQQKRVHGLFPSQTSYTFILLRNLDSFSQARISRPWLIHVESSVLTCSHSLGLKYLSWNTDDSSSTGGCCTLKSCWCPYFHRGHEHIPSHNHETGLSGFPAVGPRQCL